MSVNSPQAAQDPGSPLPSFTLALLLFGWILGLLLPWPVHLGGAVLGILLLGLALLRRSRGLAFLALIPIASWHLVNQIPQPDPQDASRIAPLRHVVLSGTIAEDPQFDGEMTRFPLTPHLLIRPKPQSLDGKIMAYFQGPPRFSKGDSIQCVGRLSLPPEDANFEGRSMRDRLRLEGIFSTLRVRRITVTGEQPQTTSSWLRKKAFSALSKGLPEDQGRLFAGITFGAALYPVPHEMRSRYQEVGLAHILAASGVQVSLLANLFTSFLLKRRKRTAALVGLFAVGGYYMIAGDCPSIVRATLMTSAGLFGLLLGRPFFPYIAFIGTALLMLILRPLWLWDIGFQFSFIATWALLSTHPGTDSKVRANIQLTAAVTLWILPIQVYHFGQCSPYGIFANVLACMLVFLLTYLGFATGVVVGFLPGLSLIMAPINGTFLWALDTIVKWILTLPGAHLNFLLPMAGLGFIYAGFALWHWLPKERGWIWCPLAMLGIAIWSASLRHPPELYVLSVGQGDALALRTKHDHWILIDTGPPTQHKLLPFLRKRGCNAIDLAVLSHPHADHIGGFIEVAQNIPIQTVWDSGAPFVDPLHDQVLSYLLTHRIPFFRPPRGSTKTIDGVSLTVLSPDHSFDKNPNANSLVVMVAANGWKVLLTGDAEEKLESELLRSQQNLQAHILKVAHHGSRFASSTAFLKAVEAKYGIVSVGPNSFRQPDALTMGRLHSKMRTFRTDCDGAVKIGFGNQLGIQCAY